MKYTKIATLLTAVVTTTLFTASAPHAEARWFKSNEPTIVDIASSQSVNFSTLVTALVKADLEDVLDGRRKFTVFAPTNAAFDAAAEALIGPGATGEELIDSLDKKTLRQILLYHVVFGELFSEDVLARDHFRTLAWKPLSRDGTTLKGIGSDADLVLELIDIDARNGVIHVINFVLLPFEP